MLQSQPPSLFVRRALTGYHCPSGTAGHPQLWSQQIQSAYNLSDMLSKHWDHPTVYPMILKLLLTRGNITLIPREATQEKEKEILNPQPEKEKKNEKENKNMK